MVGEPRFSPHRLLPGMLLARVVLRVQLTRQSNVPGSRAVIAQSIDVSVVVPVVADNAGALYRPGNHVRVEGQLDVTLIPQTTNPRAQARLKQIDEAWEAQREQLGEEELNQALRRYRNQRARFIEVPLMTVVAGYIELLSGEVLSAAEAEALLSRSNAERRRRRLAGSAAATHNAAPIGTYVAAETSNEQHEPAGDESTTSRPARRRRLPSVTEEPETPALVSGVISE